jgi:hypothetical protein
MLGVDVTLREAHITGLAIVEDPAFIYSDYDSVDTFERRYSGRYIVVEVYKGGFYRLLFRYEGEPDLAALRALHEEYLVKKQKEEEERRKVEEEMARKRKEVEEKWGNPQKVIDAIRKALPEWADGAVVVARSVCSEDCDVYYSIYPVKCSKYGDGYYYSPEWRMLTPGVPDRFLEKFADCVLLKDGKTLRVKQVKNGGSKYITLKPT